MTDKLLDRSYANIQNLSNLQIHFRHPIATSGDLYIYDKKTIEDAIEKLDWALEYINKVVNELTERESK